MSRYLEEAAALLRKSVDNNERENANYPASRAQGQERLAREFVALAAIDKGLLPAEITADVIRLIADRHPA